MEPRTVTTHTQTLAYLAANQETFIYQLKSAMQFIQCKQASLNANYALECMKKARRYLVTALFHEVDEPTMMGEKGDTAPNSNTIPFEEVVKRSRPDGTSQPE